MLQRAVALTTLALSACTPTQPMLAPCNTDDECAADELCLEGRCRAAAPSHDDAGQPAPALDGGPPLDGDAGVTPAADAGAPLDDGGAADAGDVEGGAAPDAGEDAGEDAGLVDDDAGAPTPGIASFTATPPAVALGESVTLAWSSSGLDECRIEGVRGTLAQSGSVEVARPASRPYTLVCRDGESELVAEVEVTVSCPGVSVLGTTIVDDDGDLPLGGGASGCIDVVGDLTITGLSRSDLIPLYGLRSVSGSLNIGGNASLESLDGLELLTTVGFDLRVGYAEPTPLLVNPALKSLHGLSALTSVGLDLQILEDDALGSLDGLERLASIGSDLELTGLDALTGIAALKRLTSITEQLDLVSCPRLTSLDGLDSLTTLGKDILLDDLGALGDISALGGLTGAIDGVLVRNCGALSELSGLEGITALREHLDLVANASLVDLEGLESVTTAERVYIQGNASLVSIDELSSLETIAYTGAQTCYGATTYCDGDLTVMGNPSLAAIEGLDALATVQRNLRIIDNDGLVHVTGFASLVGVWNDVIITDNAGLKEVTLLSLEDIDDLAIERNSALDALELPSLGYINDDVAVRDNDALTTLSGLAALATVRGDVRIEEHASLTNLGMTSLVEAGLTTYCTAAPCPFFVRNNGSLPTSLASALSAQVGREGGDGVDVTGNAP